jgi:hypothetical protein
VNARTNRWVIAAGIAALILGTILSRAIESGVRVEKVMLTTNTPALRLFPATPGPHPIALLAHGATGSKENCFRFGEALAAAGFECYSVDQAGHGESPQPCSFTNLLLKPQELERALGAVALAPSWASTGRRCSCWQVYLTSLFDQPGYKHERMRRSSFLPGPTTASNPSIQCS